MQIFIWSFLILFAKYTYETLNGCNCNEINYPGDCQRPELTCNWIFDRNNNKSVCVSIPCQNRLNREECSKQYLTIVQDYREHSKCFWNPLREKCLEKSEEELEELRCEDIVQKTDLDLNPSKCYDLSCNYNYTINSCFDLVENCNDLKQEHCFYFSGKDRKISGICQWITVNKTGKVTSSCEDQPFKTHPDCEDIELDFACDLYLSCKWDNKTNFCKFRKCNETTNMEFCNFQFFKNEQNDYSFCFWNGTCQEKTEKEMAELSPEKCSNISKNTYYYDYSEKTPKTNCKKCVSVFLDFILQLGILLIFTM